MITQTLFLSLAISLLFLSPSVSAKDKCNPYDKKALLKIKQSFNNVEIFASWTSNSDCCEWYMIECDERTGRITDLFIGDDIEISGSIPDAVGDLPYLQFLRFLNMPKLTGQIPQTISKLTKLKSLWISHTNITGQIPDFLSKLTHLEYINLSVNKLSGKLPASLSKLPNLQTIFVERNLLTGPIPESFGYFKSNQDFYLRLAKNQLYGQIPKSLGNVNFTELNLSRNKLSGDASVFFGKNRGLQRVDLSRNMFSFDLTKVYFPESLNSLDLSHNKIYGGLSGSLVKILSLQQFNVSYNQLCGKIPAGGDLNRFDKFSYVHNKCLCGSPLPPCKKLEMVQGDWKMN